MGKRKGAGNGSAATVGRTIDFLGYCFSRENIRLRKSIKTRFARKAKGLKDPERKRQVLASYYGWCKWGKCRNLWKV